MSCFHSWHKRCPCTCSYGHDPSPPHSLLETGSPEGTSSGSWLQLSIICLSSQSLPKYLQSIGYVPGSTLDTGFSIPDSGGPGWRSWRSQLLPTLRSDASCLALQSALLSHLPSPNPRCRSLSPLSQAPSHSIQPLSANRSFLEPMASRPHLCTCLFSHHHFSAQTLSSFISLCFSSGTYSSSEHLPVADKPASPVNSVSKHFNPPA